MKVNLLLFNDFDSAEAFAPAEVFGKMPEKFYLGYYSFRGDFVSSLQGVKIWTDFADERLSGDVLIIPGGKGARCLIRGEEQMCWLLEEIIKNHSFCVMIGSGTALVSQTGLLYRRRICDYPMDANWNRLFSAAVYRTPETKWVADGKFYSASSMISAIDMCLNILADLTELGAAEKVAAELGYVWDPDAEEGIYR